MGQSNGHSLEKQQGDQSQEILATVKLYFRSLHTCDGELFHKMWHPHGHLLGASPDGVLVDRNAETFCAGVTARTPSDTPEYLVHDRVLSVNPLDDWTAAVKVQIALPPSPNSPTPTFTPILYTDFLVMLRDKEFGWRVISKVFSGAPLGDPAVAKKLEPSDFEEATKAVWQGYVAAGRASDSKRMGSVFHPACNLTFVQDGRVVVIDSSTFCNRVGERWDLEVHRPYSHLKSDPRVSAADTLLGLDFAGPGVALATLKIGYPPFLYTDFLSLLYLSSGVPDLSSKPGWWIAAKSSANVPFMLEEAQQ